MSSPPYTAADRADLLDDLNAAQRAAVAHAGGPLLVVAGAGTGKTRVLTRRVAWLAAGGLPPRALLAITFTNKAAGVLRERLSGLPGLAEAWAGTFHAFGAWMLRRWGDRIGLDRDFTVLDREDQTRLVRDLLKDLGLSGGRASPAEFVEAISHAKGRGAGRPRLDLADPSAEVAFDRLLGAYRERCARAALLDFDDLLGEALRLLREDAETLEGLRRRFAHVLVDEYQDTNLVQRDLLLEVVGGRAGVTVVGDPDQSIYRWRGAAVRNILDFARDVPGTTTVVLERNYRSTRRILAAAEAVIARNRQRHEKRLWTENPEGAPVVEVRCRDGEHEADEVARMVEAWRREGRRLGDVAVFYRVNSLSRGLEMALRARRIPYVVVAGVEFFQRREVKDVLAYARLLANPRDDAAFLRVVNTPRRGLGDAAVEAVRAAAAAAGVPCLEALRAGVPSLSTRARQGAARFLALLDGLAALAGGPLGPLLDAIATRSGYLDSLADLGDALAEGRRENVEELVAFATGVDRREPGTGLPAFLERTALVADQDAYDAAADRVNLMSVHAAKGLEFPFVIVAGAEADWFPHARSATEAAAEEEERRLFYVAMTRAMERLAFTWAERRVTFTGLAARARTPYLRDVPPEHAEVRDLAGAPWRAGGPTAPLGSWGDPPSDEPPVVRESALPFEPGDRVRHPLFGDGRLLSCRGRGNEVRVTVDFDAYGEKQMLLTYARLERIP